MEATRKIEGASAYVEIREFHEEDRVNVDRILRENGFKDGVRGGSLFELYGKKKGNIVFVAVDRESKEVVGARECFVDMESKTADGLKLAVATHRQGEGIGMLLLKHSEATLKALGVTYMTTSPLTRESKDFLKKHGGYEYEEKEKIGDKFAEAPMGKRLD